jgi:hypothetical protein
VPQCDAMTSVMAPPTTPICAPAIWTGGAVDWWPKAMPPLWQYLLRLLSQRQTHPSLPPKGENRGPLSGYSCKSGTFRGAAMGCHELVTTTHLRFRDLGWSGG